MPSRKKAKKKQKGDQYLTREELDTFTVFNKDTGEPMYYLLDGDRYPLSQKFMWYRGYVAPIGRHYGVKFLNEIRYRMNYGHSNIILITGEAGQGKTWWALSLAQLIDKNFTIIDPSEVNDLSTDRSQVCFDRSHIMYLIGEESPLKYGQCVVIDEAQFAAGSRRWYDELQKDLMEQLESVRHKRLVIMIVALHRSLLDGIIRNHVVNYHIHVEKRGYGQPYYTWMPRFQKEAYIRKKEPLRLPMPDEYKCNSPNCLTCNLCWGTNKRSFQYDNPELLKCATLRAIYERKKTDHIGKLNRATREKIENRKKKEMAKNFTIDDYVELVYQHKEDLAHTQLGTVRVPSVKQIVLKHMAVELGHTRAGHVRSALQEKYPDVLLQKE